MLLLCQRQHYWLQMLIIGAMFGLAVWPLWRHYARGEPQRGIDWQWLNAVAGPASILFTLCAGPELYRAPAEARCGWTWPANVRPPDECGADALRPMPLGQPATGPERVGDDRR